MIGAMARIGTVCDATTYGTNARSAQREWTNTIASAETQQRAEREPEQRLAEREERLRR